MYKSNEVYPAYVVDYTNYVSTITGKIIDIDEVDEAYRAALIISSRCGYVNSFRNTMLSCLYINYDALYHGPYRRSAEAKAYIKDTCVKLRAILLMLASQYMSDKEYRDWMYEVTDARSHRDREFIANATADALHLRICYETPR